MTDCKYRISRSNLHNVREQASEALCDLNERVDTLESSPEGGVVFSYFYSASTTPPPNTSYLKFNSTTLGSISEILIDKTNTVGNYITGFVDQLRAGDIISVYETIAPNSASIWEVTGLPVDDGTYFTIPIQPTPYIGQALPAHNSPVDLQFIYARVIDHDQLENVTENQHHNKAHAHDGVDGSGTVAHGDLTGVSEDQHHAKEHAHDGVDGSGQVQHSSLQGVSEDQHHNKMHAHDGIDGSGTVGHGSLTGVSPDQHHNRAHDHSDPLDGTVSHSSLAGVGIDDHHARDHLLYGATQSDVDTTLPLEIRSILAWNASSKFAPELRMNWRGTWGQQEYQKHDMVLDSPYTMIANKVTTDRAAPQDAGDPAWAMPDIPAWQTFNQTAIVGSGHQYVFNETLYVNSVRVWVPATGVGIIYRLVTITDGFYNSRLLADLVAGEWNIVAVDPTLVGAGSTVVYYLESANTGGSTVVTGGWTRGVNSNDAEPANASWNMNNARDTLRIDFDDLDTVNRQSELEGIITGSTIQITETAQSQNNIEFQVLANPVTRTTCVEYTVAVVGEGTDEPTIGEVTTVTADVPISQPTEFVGIPNGWQINPPAWGTATSFLTFDGVDQGVAPDNQYGVDINVQRLTISPDWDVVALSGGAGGGGGGGGEPFPEPPDDGVTYGREFQNWQPVYTKSEIDAQDWVPWTNGKDIRSNSADWTIGAENQANNTYVRFYAPTNELLMGGYVRAFQGLVYNGAFKAGSSWGTGIEIWTAYNQTYDGTEGGVLRMSGYGFVNELEIGNPSKPWMTSRYPLTFNLNSNNNGTGRFAIQMNAVERFSIEVSGETKMYRAYSSQDATDPLELVTLQQLQSQGIGEVPDNGVTYGRQFGQWNAVYTQLDADLTFAPIVHVHPIFNQADAGFAPSTVTPPTGGRVLHDDGTWQEIAVPPAGGIATPYTFSTATAGAPASGVIAVNNVNQLLATEMHVSDLNTNGNDMTPFLSNLKIGDYVGINNNAGSEAVWYRISGVPIDNTTWFALPVTYYSGDGGVPDLADVNLNIINNPENRLPAGGNTDDFLMKSSNTDFHTKWQGYRDSLLFNDSLGGQPPWQEGLLFYDDVERAMSYYNDDPDITVNMGQELIARARNNSGVTIPNGSAVYLTGAIGNRPTIALARADDRSTARVAGVMTHDLANNTDGYVTLIGVVRGFDTSAWPEGTRLYLSDTVAGELTDVKPAIPSLVAVVTLQHNVNGWLYVKVTNWTSHDDLLDIGTHPHSAIDTHIDSQANPHNTSFDTLVDTPSDKTGQALKFVRVDQGEAVLEYVDTSGMFVDLTNNQTVDGIKTWNDKQVFGNTGLTVNDQFWLGAASSLAPTINFDVAGSIQYIRDPIHALLGTVNGWSAIYADGANKRFGIGTTTPEVTLHINNPDAFGCTIRLDNSFSQGANVRSYAGSMYLGAVSGGSCGLQSDSVNLLLCTTTLATFSTDVNLDGGRYQVDGAFLALPHLEDVTITTPADDEVLTYDTGKWVNKPASGGITSGTWTPTFESGSSNPLSGNRGTYQRVGNVVTVFGTFYHTNITGSAETDATFGGLPFTIKDQSTAPNTTTASGVLNPMEGMQMNQIIGGDDSGTPGSSSAYHQITVWGIEGSTSYKHMTYFGTNDVALPDEIYFSRNKNFSTIVKFSIMLVYETDDP